MIKVIKSDIESNDEEVLKWQLNQPIVRYLTVVKRCKYGYPILIILNPLNEHGTINYMSISNPLWLTCPFLNKKIHEFESNGYIKRVKEFVDSDRKQIEQMKSAHAEYYYLRRSIFNSFFHLKTSFDIYEKILNTGVGGTRDIDQVKCLHQHYGHFLICKNNIIGQVIDGLLANKTFCNEEMCKNAVKRKPDS